MAADAVAGIDEVHAVHTSTDLRRLQDAGARTPQVRSFHPARSGDLMYTTRPYILVDDEPTGTSHGSPWSYDTQVPLLWLGPGVRAGTYHSEVSVADIEHLEVLVERAGLITRGRDAQWRPCRIQTAPLETASEWIERDRDIARDRFDRLDKEIQKLKHQQEGHDHG